MGKKPDKSRGPITLLMTSRRLRHLTAFVVALPVFYVLGFGPVCRTAKNEEDLNVRITLYKPLLRMANSSGWQWPGEALYWYGGETARLMGLVVLITDTVTLDSDWGDGVALQSPTDEGP